MKVVILAAGKGSRLGNVEVPKPLTLLDSKKSLLELQLFNLSSYISLDDIFIVVGFHKEMIMEKFPDSLFVFNPSFAKENTSKSLLRALKKINDDVLWINGDVVFHPSIVLDIIGFNQTCMVVNVGSVGEEEVKYRCDFQGIILEVSKNVSKPQGEALGINFIKAKDLPLLIQGLQQCDPTDYFERGVELAIEQGLIVWSLPIRTELCTEVDFPEDLTRANSLIKKWRDF